MIGKIILCSALLGSSLFAAPEGFTALFNGKDLSGWWGLATEDPAKWMALPREELAKKKKQSLEDIATHWQVKDGLLLNDGDGLYLTTEKNYKDFELRLECKIGPKGDSGIYLRGIPQVQIWDPGENGGARHLGSGAGSGGLWNNLPNTLGKEPLVLADRPIGEWNELTISLIGEKVTVVLNGTKVVDNAVLSNHFDREKAIPEEGPIQLQTHGTPIQWRNIFIKEL